MAILGENENFPLSRILMAGDPRIPQATTPKPATTALPVPVATTTPVATAGYTPPTPNYSLGGDLTGNLTETAAKQNLAGMDELTAMSNYINTLNIAAQQAALQSRIPGSVGLEQQSSQNIAAGLAGQIDPGTQRQIGEWAAARGIMSGSVGGPINDTAFLKLMSDTAYEREQQAQQNLNAAYARNPAAPIFDVSSQLLGPSQLGQLSLSQAEALSREKLTARQQDEVERAAAVKESQLGRQLTEEERAALERESIARAALEENIRSSLERESLARDEFDLRLSASTPPRNPQGITGEYSPGGQIFSYV